MSSIFALQLSEAGYAQSTQLVPLTFLVIAGTVALYGLSAAAVARWLQVGQQNPQGVLFIDASPLSRAIAEALQAEHYATCLIDPDWSYITTARMSGLRTYYGNALTAEALDNIDMDGIGRVLALTPNDEANALATLHFAEIFGRDETYQLSPSEAVEDPALHLRGRFLFDETANYTVLSRQIKDGAAIKTTRLSDQFDYEAFQALYQGEALLLFVISATDHLTIHTMDAPLAPVPGEMIISLIPAPILTVTSAVPDASDAGNTSPQ